MENGKVPGALHLYVGQEAVATGVMVHRTDADQITSTTTVAEVCTGCVNCAAAACMFARTTHALAPTC